MRYKQWYVEKNTKFLGTWKMFIDAGKDPESEDVYTVELPYEISILNKYKPTEHRLVFQKEPEYDEERKTVILHVTLETIGEEHKKRITENFIDKFKEELAGTYNVFDKNIPFIYHRDGKQYILSSPLLLVVLCYWFLSKVRLHIDNGILREIVFIEGTYPLIFKDENQDTVLLTVDSSELNGLVHQYISILGNYVSSIEELFYHIQHYNYDDINRLLGGLSHFSGKNG